MAKRNYIKITNGSSSKNLRGKWDDCSLIIGFYKADGELVDVMDTEFDYINNGMQDMILRWIYDGVSPSEFEDSVKLGYIEESAYGKHYNR